MAHNKLRFEYIILELLQDIIKIECLYKMWGYSRSREWDRALIPRTINEWIGYQSFIESQVSDIEQITEANIPGIKAKLGYNGKTITYQDSEFNSFANFVKDYYDTSFVSFARVFKDSDKFTFAPTILRFNDTAVKALDEQQFSEPNARAKRNALLKEASELEQLAAEKAGFRELTSNNYEAAAKLPEEEARRRLRSPAKRELSQNEEERLKTRKNVMRRIQPLTQLFNLLGYSIKLFNGDYDQLIDKMESPQFDTANFIGINANAKAGKKVCVLNSISRVTRQGSQGHIVASIFWYKGDKLTCALYDPIYYSKDEEDPDKNYLWALNTLYVSLKSYYKALGIPIDIVNLSLKYCITKNGKGLRCPQYYINAEYCAIFSLYFLFCYAKNNENCLDDDACLKKSVEDSYIISPALLNRAPDKATNKFRLVFMSFLLTVLTLVSTDYEVLSKIKERYNQLKPYNILEPTILKLLKAKTAEKDAAMAREALTRADMQLQRKDYAYALKSLKEAASLNEGLNLREKIGAIQPIYDAQVESAMSKINALKTNMSAAASLGTRNGIRGALSKLGAITSLYTDIGYDWQEMPKNIQEKRGVLEGMDHDLIEKEIELAVRKEASDAMNQGDPEKALNILRLSKDGARLSQRTWTRMFKPFDVEKEIKAAENAIAKKGVRPPGGSPKHNTRRFNARKRRSTRRLNA